MGFSTKRLLIQVLASQKILHKKGSLCMFDENKKNIGKLRECLGNLENLKCEHIRTKTAVWRAVGFIKV